MEIQKVFRFNLAALAALFIPLHVTFSAERPTGHNSAEGIACDAVQAYIDCDAKAWLATLVRPMYGEEGNIKYKAFKKSMAQTTTANKTNKNFVAPKIIKVFKARTFTMNGPGSMAFALHGFIGNEFVDIVIDMGGGNNQQIRYHLLKDKDKKWYFEPRPDLTSFIAMGLNAEKPSKDIFWELNKKKKKEISYSDQTAAILLEIQQLKPGMTRSDVLKIFRAEGGLSTRTSIHYVHKKCAFIKVDFTFTPVGKVDKFAVSGKDEIKKISRPYLQRAIGD